MFALAARSMGYRIHIYSPESAGPAGPVADRETVAEYDDLDRVREFSRSVEVVTFEFENIPSATTAVVSESVPVRPAGRILHTTQNRLREKTFLQVNGFPVTPFRRIRSSEELTTAVRELGLPGVLKTADFGYDGKGQVKLLDPGETSVAWEQLNGKEGIYERFVDFEKELSVVAARTAQGKFAAFPLFENSHARHILDLTVAPAEVEPSTAKEAEVLARGILECRGAVGVVTVEMFLTRDGRVLVNELAPRTHNSGHLTIDAAVTSQFEQQARAVCSLPLGSTELKQPAAMANLLGDLWAEREPDWVAALSDPRIKLHLYGKNEPRPGRKMGHLTAAAESVADARRLVLEARQRAGGDRGTSRHLGDNPQPGA
jgi:5-(carboxyamino)imidazole ribonucleotide synthase